MAIGQQLASITNNISYLDKRDRYKTTEIEDIPVLLNDEGAIVCIPKSDETRAMAFVGNSGMGKTLLMNRVHSHIYYLWKDNVAILNDVSEETYHWSEPMVNEVFNNFNRLHLNQEPIASPLVYIFPNTQTLDIPYERLKYKNYLRTVLPFQEVMEDLQFYLAGVNPKFELGKSGIYVNQIKEDLLDCETPNQIRSVLDANLPGKDGKSFQAMRQKILTAFDSLLREEILDITNPEYHSYIQIKEDDYLADPLNVIMKLGMIPSLVTSDLINKKYKSQVFAYYINQIFENNLKTFPNKKTYLFFDELRDICIDEDDVAANAISRISSRGRIKNVGLCYATQFYNQIPHSIRGAKLNYLFSFKHSDDKIVNEIKKDFSLHKNWKDKIFKLKPFECIAMTQNHFVLYRDDERWETTEPQRGQIFYPIANHKKAGVKLK